VPATYTGDQTNTQAPSNPPEPGGSIQQSLPADGDPPNASTWEQAYKVTADFIDWLMKPRAVPGAANWVKEIFGYRAANGHRRHAIDHLGFPTGQVLVKDVNWVQSPTSVANQSGIAASYTAYVAMPEWSYRSAQTAGLSWAVPAASVFGPSIACRPGEGLNDYLTVFHAPQGSLLADNNVSLEFTGRVPSFGIKTLVAVCDEPSTQIDALSAFIGFRIDGATDWKCVTKAAGVETVTASGVTAAIGAARPDRLRVEWSGETVADDSVRAVRFYINGGLVATHTTNLPLAMLAGIGISQVRTTAAVGGEYLLLGPMRMRMSLSELDTVL
jgi:hypothetical protein